VVALGGDGGGGGGSDGVGNVTMTMSTAKYCTNMKTQHTTVGWTCTANRERGKTKAAFPLKGYQTILRDQSMPRASWQLGFADLIHTFVQ